MNYKKENLAIKGVNQMARQYENLNHINVDHLSLVRSDKRERRGKVGSTSKVNKAILKQMVACKGEMPRCPISGQWIAVSKMNKLQKERGV
tara:strand:+ start:163 stop:435 length:273 start_codon:yes stop_codon:yes gene_type:complete